MIKNLKTIRTLIIDSVLKAKQKYMNKQFLKSECRSEVVFFICVYIGINLLLLNFAPILHESFLEITIVNSENESLMAEVSIKKKRYPHEDYEIIGTTNSEGFLEFSEHFPERGTWVWPRLGIKANFSKQKLFIEKIGFISQEVEIPQYDGQSYCLKVNLIRKN